jgi:hypothetical protein
MLPEIPHQSKKGEHKPKLPPSQLAHFKTTSALFLISQIGNPATPTNQTTSTLLRKYPGGIPAFALFRLQTRLRVSAFATVNLRYRSLHADSQRSPRHPRLPGMQNAAAPAHRRCQRPPMSNVPPHLPGPRRNSRPDHRPGHQSTRLNAIFLRNAEKSPSIAKNHAHFAH